MKPIFILAALGLVGAGQGIPVQRAQAADVTSVGLKNLAPVAAVLPCEQLAHADFSTVPDAPTQISAARTETDTATGQTVCHIVGFVTPQVKFEMKLPDRTWTQRLLMTGCGGLCGSIGMRVEHANDCLPANQGELAIVATNMGHEGQGGLWAKDDPILRTDFAYRGVHVVTLAAKAIVAKYYGRAQAYSYFSGCSDGGREALMEAQRYPDDFDGIAAGAPAANFTVQNSFYHAWNAVSNTGPDGRGILLPAKLPALHAAVVKACDKLDGVTDGIIGDPTRCHFDPVVLQCAAGQSEDTCLTPAEVEATRRIYAGANDGKGTRFVVGAPMPGSELAWQGVEVPFNPEGIVPSTFFAEDSIKYLLHWPSLPADWRVKNFEFTSETFAAMTAFNSLYGATDPDLSAYFKRGGRLLMWHGWSDQHISPINSIAYFRAVEATLGADATRDGMRFYVFPGLYHCGGGDGLNEFDVLTPTMAWVESGKAPDGLNAGHSEQRPMEGPPPADANPDKTGAPQGLSSGSPPAAPVTAMVMVKPYPLLADFVPAKGKKAPVLVNGYGKYIPAPWAGEGLYKPYKHQVCEWNGNTYSCPEG